MKLMIASDLHGSAWYTNCLFRRWGEEKAERLVLLGDILYHGPRNDLPRDYNTKTSAALLNAVTPPPLCVRGNCDGEVDQMVLSFPSMAEYAVLFIDGRTLYLTHGHRRETLTSALGEGDVLLYGHTHVPDYSVRGGVLHVNPGSVSLPKEGTRHSYLLLEDGLFTWKDVESGEVFRQEKM